MSPAEAAIGAARRIVLKIGSSSVTTPDGRPDSGRVAQLAELTSRWRARGCDVVIVSSGAIAAGLAPLGLTRRPDEIALAQAAAAVGQGLLVRAYEDAFARHDQRVAQVLLTETDVVRRSTYKTVRGALAALLDLGAIPIVNENDTVATHEIRFGDNDRLAALVAQLVRAELFVLLTDVDALYTAPPSEPGSERIALVRGPEDLGGVTVGTVGSGVGTGGMVTKLEAASIASLTGTTTVLTSADRLEEIVEGHNPGTLFPPRRGHRPSRRVWLRYATRGAGTIRIDAGAQHALTQTGSSLLAVGITAIEGDFLDRVPVDVAGPDGTVVARGITAYSSEQLRRMVGRSKDELAAMHGGRGVRPVLHRDHLVLIQPTL